MKRKPYMVVLLMGGREIGPLPVADAQRRFPDWHDAIAATSRDGATRCFACDAGSLYISRSGEREA